MVDYREWSGADRARMAQASELGRLENCEYSAVIQRVNMALDQLPD